MKNCQPVLILLMVLVLLLSILLILPSESRSETVSGTSPILLPGETFEVTVDEVGSDTILWWGWFSDEDVTFWVEGPNGTNFTSVLDHDAILIDLSGTYTLIWKNDNAVASLQVVYYYENFFPLSGITEPTPGSTISNLTPTIFGTKDPKAINIRVSTDNVVFHDAVIDNQTWSWNATLSPGQNAIFVESTYWNGYFEYRHIQPFELNVDTLWLYEENGDTKIGLGIIAVVIVIIVDALLVTIYLRKSRKKK